MDLKKLSLPLFLISAALLAFVLYRQYQQRNQPATPPPPVAPTAGTAPASAPPAGSLAETAEGKPRLFAGNPSPAGKFVIGSTDPRSGYLLAVEVIGNGAAVNTIKLSRFFATVDDKRLWEDDPDAYESARANDPAKYHGHYSLLNPVAGEGKPFLPLTTRRIFVGLPEGDGGEVVWYQGNLADLGWDVLEQKEDSIRLGCDLHLGRDWQEAKTRPVLRVIKTYRVSKQDYTVEMSLEMENLSAKPVRVRLYQAGPTGLPREDIRADGRMAAYGRLNSGDQQVQCVLKKADELTKDKGAAMPPGQDVLAGAVTDASPVLWIGHVNKFFGSMLYVVPEEDRLEAAEWGGQFYVAAARENAQSLTYLTGVEFPDVAIKADQAKTIRLQLFAGPKQRSVFVDADDPQFKPIYRKLSYAGTIDLGGCFCAWDSLTLGMMWLLKKLAAIAFGNYGLGVIVLVVLVRVVLHPLARRSQVSAMKMQKLGPEMQRLKEKYADDKETLNKEMMRFYKEQGATPLLGCLPMVIQMPIWIALWTSINASVELRHAGLLPVWITDLAAPDSLFSWGASLPVIGTQFNLLPILLTAAMYLQMKFSPQTPQAAAGTDAQKQQQKMMQYMMPAMMLFFFYNAPSGLTLYIMTSTAASVAEQYFIRKHIQAKEAAEAARETTVDLPGKGARGARPKKPRGPFWVKRG